MLCELRQRLLTFGPVWVARSRAISAIRRSRWRRRGRSLGTIPINGYGLRARPSTPTRPSPTPSTCSLPPIHRLVLGRVARSSLAEAGGGLGAVLDLELVQ